MGEIGKQNIERILRCAQWRIFTLKYSKMIGGIIAFVFQWTVGAAVILCDIVVHIIQDFIALMEMLVIEALSIMHVVIDVWKPEHEDEQTVDKAGGLPVKELFPANEKEKSPAKVAVEQTN